MGEQKSTYHLGKIVDHLFESHLTQNFFVVCYLFIRAPVSIFSRDWAGPPIFLLLFMFLFYQPFCLSSFHKLFLVAEGAKSAQPLLLLFPLAIAKGFKNISSNDFALDNF